MGAIAPIINHILKGGITMIDTTSEQSIVANLISNVLGENKFVIVLNKLIVLSVEVEDYCKCEIEFLKDSDNLPVMFVYERSKSRLGNWSERNSARYFEVGDFSWGETFKRLQYYINYYTDLLKDFYDVKVYETDEYFDFSRRGREIILKRQGKQHTNIVYSFKKKYSK